MRTSGHIANCTLFCSLPVTCAARTAPISAMGAADLVSATLVTDILQVTTTSCCAYPT